MLKVKSRGQQHQVFVVGGGESSYILLHSLKTGKAILGFLSALNWGVKFEFPIDGAGRPPAASDSSDSASPTLSQSQLRLCPREEAGALLCGGPPDSPIVVSRAAILAVLPPNLVSYSARLGRILGEQSLGAEFKWLSNHRREHPEGLGGP